MSQKPKGVSRHIAKVPEIEANQLAVDAVVEDLVIVDEVPAVAIESAAAMPEPVLDVIETIAVSIEAVPATPIPSPLLKGHKTMMKSTEDFVAFGQANLDAFVKSGQIWSAGMQEMTKLFATTAKASFDESVSTFKALGTVKSMQEAIELQSSFAKVSLEKAMAESNKMTDASIKLTEQAIAPIAARMTVAVENFGKAA